MAEKALEIVGRTSKELDIESWLDEELCCVFWTKPSPMRMSNH